MSQCELVKRDLQQVMRHMLPFRELPFMLCIVLSITLYVDFRLCNFASMQTLHSYHTVLPTHHSSHFVSDSVDFRLRDDVRDFKPFLQRLAADAQTREVVLRKDGNTEINTLLGMVLIGANWDLGVEMFDSENFDAFNMEDTVENLGAHTPQSAKAYLLGEAGKSWTTNKALALTMQAKLAKLIRTTCADVQSPVLRAVLDADVDPSDYLHGSRLLWRLRDAMFGLVKRVRNKYIHSVDDIAQQIVNDGSSITAAIMHQHMEQLKAAINVASFGGEDAVLEHNACVTFLEILKRSPHAPITMAAYSLLQQDATKSTEKHKCRDASADAEAGSTTSKTGSSSSLSSSDINLKVQTLVTTFVSILDDDVLGVTASMAAVSGRSSIPRSGSPSSGRPANSGSGNGLFSAFTSFMSPSTVRAPPPRPPQVSPPDEKKKLQDQIKKLREELAQAKRVPPSSAAAPSGGGFANRRPKGRYKNRAYTSQTAVPSEDRPQHDEANAFFGAVEGVEENTMQSLTWWSSFPFKVSLVLLALVPLLFALAFAFDIPLFQSMLAVGSVGSIAIGKDRHWHTGGVCLGGIVLLLASCWLPIRGANALEIQLSNASDTLLTANFVFSPFTSSTCADIISAANSTAGALFVSHGETLTSECTWCVDSGANRHICHDRAYFTNYRQANITVTVARKNITMQAVGVGDCKLKVMDNDDTIVFLNLTNVLHIPESTRNLFSPHVQGQSGYQCVLPCTDSLFEPGLYAPKRKQHLFAHSGASQSSAHQYRFVPFECVNSLLYLRTFTDLIPDGVHGPLTRSNPYLVWHRRLGFLPIETLRQTIPCVRGLENLTSATFPAKYISPEVQMGKMQNRDRPHSHPTAAPRPMAGIHWDIFGPAKTRSLNGSHYAVVFVDDHSGYTWIYGLPSKGHMYQTLEQFYADTAPLRERHGNILWVRRDNAGENISQQVEQFLRRHSIKSETSNPYEPWQNGTAERAIQTILRTARTVIVSSGLLGRFWLHACHYSNAIHNLQHCARLKTSPYVSMHQEKPDVSDFQIFGVECWLYRQPDQRPDKKFSSIGEPCIYLGPALNRKGHVVWCPARGLNVITTSTNVNFGTRCPYSKRSPVEIIPQGVTDMHLSSRPPPLTLIELETANDAHVVGSYDGHFVVMGRGIESGRLLQPSQLMPTLAVVQDHGYRSAFLSLTASLDCYEHPFPSVNLSESSLCP